MFLVVSCSYTKHSQLFKSPTRRLCNSWHFAWALLSRTLLSCLLITITRDCSALHTKPNPESMMSYVRKMSPIPSQARQSSTTACHLEKRRRGSADSNTATSSSSTETSSSIRQSDGKRRVSILTKPITPGFAPTPTQGFLRGRGHVKAAVACRSSPG